MRNLVKGSLIGMAALIGSFAISGAASANTITISFKSVAGLLCVSAGTTCTLTPGQVGGAVGIHVYANFSDVGGGQNFAGISMQYNGGSDAGCAEKAAGTTITGDPGGNSSTWAPLTAGCGPVALGGTQRRAMEANKTGGVDAQLGTILIGTVTFTVGGSGAINAVFVTGLDGFIGTDFATRAPTSLGSLTVNVIPEPATVALLATGMLGLLGFSRRWKR